MPPKKRPPQTQREKAWEKLFAVLAEVHANLPPSKKSPREQEEEIAQMVTEVRRERLRKTNKEPENS